MALPLRTARPVATRTPPRGSHDSASSEPSRDSTIAAPAAPSAPPRFGITDLSLVLMALIWGVNFSVVKYGTELVAPLAYNAARVALAALSLALITQIAARRGDVAARWPARRDALALLALGVLGNGIYQIFFVEGVATTRASDAALVIASSPAFIALIGRLRGTERIALRGMIGIALSVAGIGFVVTSGAGDDAGRHARLLGDALILGGSLCWSVYTVLLEPYTHRVGGLPLSALTMLGGLVPLLLVGTPSMLTTSWSAVSPRAWSAIAYSGLGALVLAYLFWYRGVRVIGPTRTAMYSNLQPVFAVAVAWLMLGETPTLLQGIGAALIMGGLLLTRAR